MDINETDTNKKDEYERGLAEALSGAADAINAATNDTLAQKQGAAKTANTKKPARTTKNAAKAKTDAPTDTEAQDIGNQTADATYSKEQILNAKGNKDRRDLLNALLDGTQRYTKAQVIELVNDYLKKPTNGRKSRHNYAIKHNGEGAVK